MAEAVFVVNDEELEFWNGEMLYKILEKIANAEMEAFDGKASREMKRMFGFDIYAQVRIYVERYLGMEWEKYKRYLAEMSASYAFITDNLLSWEEEYPSRREMEEALTTGRRSFPYKVAFDLTSRQLRKVILELADKNEAHPLAAALFYYPDINFWEEHVLKPLDPLAVKLPLVRTRLFAAAVFYEVVTGMLLPMLADEYEFRNGPKSAMFI